MDSLMDMAGPRRPVLLKSKPVLLFLSVLSALYGWICGVRILMFRWGVLRTRRLNTLVISVGNLTAGGTGKTPLVIALAGILSRRGMRPAVLSRGYKRQRREPVKWVSDGRSILADPREAGDEPYLLATRLTGIPVVVGADRYRAGRELLHRCRVNAILLDDGYQHLYLHRDVNLLLIDGTLPFGPGPAGGRLLPRGTLREPLSAMRRASAVLVSRMEQTGRWDEIHRAVQALHPGVPVFRVFFRPTALIHVLSGEEGEPGRLKDRSVVAASGIGRPDTFRFFLEGVGAKMSAALEWEDHHDYSAADVGRMLAVARGRNADFVVTTEKDAVKIKKHLRSQDPVWALRVEVDRIEDSKSWERFIGERIGIH